MTLCIAGETEVHFLLKFKSHNGHFISRPNVFSSVCWTETFTDRSCRKNVTNLSPLGVFHISCYFRNNNDCQNADAVIITLCVYFETFDYVQSKRTSRLF
jgi:hypothetical protein